MNCHDALLYPSKYTRRLHLTSPHLPSPPLLSPLTLGPQLDILPDLGDVDDSPEEVVPGNETQVCVFVCVCVLLTELPQHSKRESVLAQEKAPPHLTSPHLPERGSGPADEVSGKHQVRLGAGRVSPGQAVPVPGEASAGRVDRSRAFTFTTVNFTIGNFRLFV